jgi:hypothetical protein
LNQAEKKGTRSPPSLPVLSQAPSHWAEGACGLTWVVAGQGFVTALNSALVWGTIPIVPEEPDKGS